MILDWIALILSVIGIYFNANKNKLCWPIWAFSSVLWTIYYFIVGEIPSGITWLIFLGSNIYGWVKWSKDES